MAERLLSIDRFRGLAILMMVAVNYMGGVDAIPAFLKHAPDIGYTVADVVAPMFIFAIGLTYGPGFARRLQAGRQAAYMHFITRYFAILGIGALFTLGGNAVAGQHDNWGVLEAIGAAGIICLVFIRWNWKVRLAAGAAILCGYQIALANGLLGVVLSSSHGGIYGALSWGAMLLLATVLADAWRSGTKQYAAACGAFAAAAVVAALIVPVSKNRVSASYVLVSLVISGFAFLLFALAEKKKPVPAGPLCWWGENPMALYILHLMVLGLFVLPGAAWWYAAAPAWLAALQMAALFAILTCIAYALHRRRIVIRL